jgi:RHS repeat-associated protein
LSAKASASAGGVGGLLSVTKHQAQSTTHYFPTFDGNGNVSEYLDAGGVIVAHYEYDPFGRTIVESGPNAADFAYRFSTKPVDAATGLYYYGYRWYDPYTGRWINRDPIEESGGVNLYGFVGNQATQKSDFLGLVEDEDAFVIEQVGDGLEVVVDGAVDIEKVKNAGRQAMFEVVKEARDSISKGSFSGGPYQFDAKLLDSIEDAARNGRPTRISIPNSAKVSLAGASAALDIWAFKEWIGGGAMTKYQKVHRIAVNLSKAENSKHDICCSLCLAIDEFAKGVPMPLLPAYLHVTQAAPTCVTDCDRFPKE